MRFKEVSKADHNEHLNRFVEDEICDCYLYRHCQSLAVTVEVVELVSKVQYSQ